MFWLYTTVQYRNSRSSNFFVFHTSGGISSRPAAFPFLIFVITTSRSSCVDCPSLMSSWSLITFVIGLSLTLRGFPSRFLKCSFHMCIHSFWLATFSLALEVRFLLFISFTICHTIRDCPSSNEILIPLIWLWMYSIYSFWFVFISSLCAFVSSWALVLDGFLLLHRDTVFTLSRFFLTANAFHRSLCLPLSLVGMLLLPSGRGRSSHIHHSK